MKPHVGSEVNLLSSYLPMCVFTAQLVEHRTGFAEVTGSNPVEALIFFKLLPSNCVNWKIYCDEHFSLSSTTTVQYEFHIHFTKDESVGSSSSHVPARPHVHFLPFVCSVLYFLFAARNFVLAVRVSQ